MLNQRRIACIRRFGCQKGVYYLLFGAICLIVFFWFFSGTNDGTVSTPILSTVIINKADEVPKMNVDTVSMPILGTVIKNNDEKVSNTNVGTASTPTRHTVTNKHEDEEPPVRNFTIKFTNYQGEVSLKRPEPNPCKGKKIQLFMFSVSVGNNLVRRNGIRQSWAKDALDGMLLRFVIGPSPDNNETLLEAEQAQFGDIIRYEGVEDKWLNLHLKMFAAFQWFLTYCPHAEFVWDVMDDNVVDLPRWHFWKEHKFEQVVRQTPAVLFGRVHQTDIGRNPKDKWWSPVEFYPGNKYPPHMHGASYFGTPLAFRKILQHTNEVYGHFLDDVMYTGILAARANVTLHDLSKHFNVEPPWIINVKEIEECEQGEPLIMSLHYNEPKMTTVEQYKAAYAKLHAAKCK